MSNSTIIQIYPAVEISISSPMNTRVYVPTNLLVLERCTADKGFNRVQCPLSLIPDHWIAKVSDTADLSHVCYRIQTEPPTPLGYFCAGAATCACVSWYVLYPTSSYLIIISFAGRTGSGQIYCPIFPFDGRFCEWLMVSTDGSKRCNPSLFPVHFQSPWSWFLLISEDPVMYLQNC